MAVAMIGPKFYAWDRNGKPLAFGKLYTYQARTNTPKPTYQSEDQVIENSNPVILNGEGYANVYLDGSYKVVLKDSDENEIWTADPVTASQAEEWVNCVPATYVSPTTFTINGNLTDKYEQGRRARVNNGLSNYAYSTIESSSFAGGVTTVVLSDAVVTTGIIDVCSSFVSFESGGSDINSENISDFKVVSTGFSEGRSFSDRFSNIELQTGDADFVFEGDSITAGNTIGGYQYSNVFAGLSFARNRGSVSNFAVGGSFISFQTPSLQDRYFTDVYPLRPSANGGSGKEQVFLFVLAGTNDLDTRFGNRTDLNVISDLTAYTQQAMADGFTVVLQTILPRVSNQTGWDVQTEKYRIAINANIRRGSIPCDIVADTESFVNDVTSSTMFHDGIHPTQLGSDMIAAYLNNVMMASGALEMGNLIQGRAIQGFFESKDKTMVKVGSEFCSVSLGTDLNENKNGFLIIENLNADTNDAKLWFFETGIDGNKVKILPVGSGGVGSGKPALTFNRTSTRAWTEFGNSFMKTFLGQPNSDTDFGRMLMLNMNPNATGNPNESMWAWEMETSAVRPESYKLTMCDDDGANPVTAVEFKRDGKELTSMAVSGQVSTKSTTGNITDANWALGTIKASAGGNAINATKYIQVEINGELVNIAVINDPTPS